MQTEHKYSRSGFTLIELLVVISIITLLASIAAVSAAGARRAARDSVVQSDLQTLAQSLNLYGGDHSDYPPADPATNDTGVDDLGTDSCDNNYGPWQNSLVTSGYINQTVSLPANANQFCYFHKIPSTNGNASALLYNYCTIGVSCGFSKTQFPDYLSCFSASDKNPDATLDPPTSKAAIIFWLEGGLSKNYQNTGYNPWFDPTGNVICLN